MENGSVIAPRAATLAVAIAWALIGASGCAEVEDRAPFVVSMRTWPNSAVRLEGVELCETDTDNCQLTDASGFATVYLPPGQEISVTVEEKGYQSELYPLIVPVDGALFQASLQAEQRLETEFANVGSPYPMVDTGMISIVVAPQPQCEGVTIKVFGAAGEGKVHYLDDDPDVTWSPYREATSTIGIAVAVELPPGDYRVEIGGEADHCIPVTGWPSLSANSVRLPVRAGFQSEAHMSCDCS